MVFVALENSINDKTPTSTSGGKPFAPIGVTIKRCKSADIVLQCGAENVFV